MWHSCKLYISATNIWPFHVWRILFTIFKKWIDISQSINLFIWQIKFFTFMYTFFFSSTCKEICYWFTDMSTPVDTILSQIKSWQAQTVPFPSVFILISTEIKIELIQHVIHHRSAWLKCKKNKQNKTKEYSEHRATTNMYLQRPQTEKIHSSKPATSKGNHESSHSIWTGELMHLTTTCCIMWQLLTSAKHMLTKCCPDAQAQMCCCASDMCSCEDVWRH